MANKPPVSLSTLSADFVSTRMAWLTSGKDYAALPEKIRTSIQLQQNSSERLIGWIQLTILLAFSLLYIAAPKTAPITAEIEPVPFFLTAYLTFTCLRLYLSYRSQLGFWMLLLSILVDMALLLGLIWSFHIQYMQPPAFYLKAPTLLYIFIFIALRALRFEPGYVLISGLIGAAGWFLLLLYAVVSDPAQSAITNDYIHYLTSTSILIGGELDKILSILVVTVILTLAIARGRALLIQSIVEADAAENLSLFVPEGVSDRIASADGLLLDAKTESREASILFVDLVSFTSLAEQLTPEKLIGVLNEYFYVIAKAIEEHNGVIHQFQGDAVLASFNLPTKDLKHASHAVSAALNIQRSVSKHTFAGDIKLATRTGVNTGVVVGGFIGTKDRLSYTVYGDVVNIAARLQELAKNYDANNLVSARTKALCDNKQFLFEPMGTEVLRGRQGEVRIYQAKLKP